MPDFTISLPVPVTITADNAAEAWWIMARYFGCKCDGLPASQWAAAEVPLSADMATCVPTVKGKASSSASSTGQTESAHGTN